MSKIEINTPSMIERIRASSKIAAACLQEVEKMIEPGISTQDIDDLARTFIFDHGAYPSPLHYHGFPRSVCTSINEVICHGIPSKKRILKEGDIINVDVTTYYPRKGGMHGDTSKTFFVGEPSPTAKRLVEITEKCMYLGIEEVTEGARFGNIGAAIQEHAEENGFHVVREFVGHGVGRHFHMQPQVEHYGTRGAGKKIKAGMVFTIEPMINETDAYADVLEDGWTAVTSDGKLSAQFEHTVLATKTGYEILTLP